MDPARLTVKAEWRGLNGTRERSPSRWTTGQSCTNFQNGPPVRGRPYPVHCKELPYSKALREMMEHMRCDTSIFSHLGQYDSPKPYGKALWLQYDRGRSRPIRNRRLLFRLPCGSRKALLTTLALVLSGLLLLMNTDRAGAANSVCYGETIDLRLITGVKREYLSLHLHLPHTDVWIVNVGNNRNLIDLPCGTEPVEAYGSVSPVSHPILPTAVRTTLQREGVLLTILSFTTISYEGLEYYRWSKDYWWNNVFSTATPTSEGHLWKPSVLDDAIGGAWLLSDAYLDEAGGRIRIVCALDCEVTYRLREHLRVRYHLVVSDKSKRPNWVDLDKALRHVFKEWIEDN